MNALLKKVRWIFLLTGLSTGGFAQSLDQAKKLYNEGQYEDAKPAFEKLVNQSPNNSSYNLWYGVCCYETGELAAAEKYLLVAYNRKVVESSRYLANIYFSSQRFEQAIPMWEEYIALLEKKKEDTEEYEALLEKAGKMLRMQEKTEDVQVIDSIVVSKDQILSAYYLSEDCGALQMYDDFFQSSGSQLSTVYINPKKDLVYYARPDDTGQHSLYTQSRLMDAWADEKALFANEADNNYPFVLGDGVTLYFASTGNGSIGGYDLFVTRYNAGSNSFLAPEQLGMPFNSTANDYLMVIDEVKNVGWFVSDRNQPEGLVCIYLFIPDESRKRVVADSEDGDWLRERAVLTSIKDTWVKGRDYSAQIRLAQTDDASKEKKVKRDFEFVINDRTTYYTWSEFRSAEAKMSYEKVVGLKKQAQSIEDKLGEARTAYTKGNSSAREQLRPSILQAEEKLDELFSQISEWEKKVRNTENIKLKN